VHSAQGVTTDTAHAVLGENTSRALLYVAMTRGHDSNTAYLHERIAGENEHSQSGGVHVAYRGTSRDAAQLARTLITHHDDQVRTAHDIAAETANNSALPERIRSILRRRADAIQQRHTTYQQWRDAAEGLDIDDDRTVDQHIDRSQDKDIGYQAAL
jgi:hypothetical protein